MVLLTVVLPVPAAPSLRPGDAVPSRSWLLGEGDTGELHALLYKLRWTWVVDADGGLHAASPCTRVYLGHQPDNLHADTWTIAVTGTVDQPGWRARFDRETPVEVVLSVLNTLVDGTGR